MSFSARTGKPDQAPREAIDYSLLFAPIQERERATGLVEVWLPTNLERPAGPTAMRLVVELAGLVSRFLGNQQARQAVDRQAISDQIEALDCAVHASLHPTEVAFVVANETRRLLGVDRVSVAIRAGRHARVEAVSGTDRPGRAPRQHRAATS